MLALTGAISLALVWVETPYGTLEIQTKDDDVQVVIKQRGKEVDLFDTKAKRTVKLKTGTYELELRDNERSLELSTNSFTLKRGDTEVVKVRRGKPGTPGSGAPDKGPLDLSQVEPLRDSDFSKPGTDFGSSRNEEWGWDIRAASNHYVMLLNPRPKMSNRYLFMDPIIPVKVDFACRVTGRVQGKGDEGWAIGLLSSQAQAVGIRLRRDGRVEVGNVFWKDEGPVTTVQPIQHPAVRSGEEFNSLLVICRGGRRLDIFVNDSPLGQPIQLPLPLGEVRPGLVFWQRGWGQGEGRRLLEGRAEFKRYTLWQLPQPVPAVP